jgi:hypothetical protein
VDRREETLQRGGAHPAERRDGVGGSRQRAKGQQPIQEFGEKRLEANGPDLTARVPEDLGGGHVGPYSRGRPVHAARGVMRGGRCRRRRAALR